jgi:hypothetical protein
MHVTGLPADRHVDGFGGNPRPQPAAASRKSHAENSVPPAHAGVKRQRGSSKVRMNG